MTESLVESTEAIVHLAEQRAQTRGEYRVQSGCVDPVQILPCFLETILAHRELPQTQHQERIVRGQVLFRRAHRRSESIALIGLLENLAQVQMSGAVVRANL
ncbi:MAG: hypothetical protein OEN23_00225 [Paracoccaceae bacterium]|nr:hypothetical protein [Paracoccaceae bacterium]